MSAITTHEIDAVAALHADPLAGLQKVITFQLGDEEYAMDLLRVQEIRSYEKPNRIAGSEPDCAGVIQLREHVVPVIDLRVRLGLREVSYDFRTVVMILNLDGHVTGVVVDAVCDVLELAPGDIKPAPEFERQSSRPHMIGIAPIQQRDHRRMLIVVDPVKLLR